ncbi:DUF4347 domain-containing protein, partial [Litoribacillus peritrichatus]|uniref:DUF4347 domain-containing protein n=1 Tax=Litoribacillus peritrichatus TaxID=718191 RepID=UPI0031E11D41
MNKHVLNGITSAMMSLGVCGAPVQAYSSAQTMYGAVQAYSRQHRGISTPASLNTQHLDLTDRNFFTERGFQDKTGSVPNKVGMQPLTTSSLVQKVNPVSDLYIENFTEKNIETSTADFTDHSSSVELVIDARHIVSELIIIDQAVPDKHAFYQSIKPGVEVKEIASGQDGLIQLTDILHRYKNLDALHIVSHAEDGVIYLGNTEVTEQLLIKEVNTLSVLNNSMKDNADLLLYGCELAKTEKGEALLALIANNANVDIAASDDYTGASALEGDWDLEIKKGDINSHNVFSEQALKDFNNILSFTTTHAGHKFCDTGSCNTPVSYGDLTLNAPYQVSDYSTTSLYITGDNAEATFTFTITDTGALYSFQLDALSLVTYSGANACDITVEGFYASNNASTGTNTISKTDANNGAMTITNVTGKALNKFTVKVCSGGADSGQGNHGISSFTLSNHVAPAANPTITNVTYDSSTGNLVVTGTNFEAKSGAANDITVNKLTLTGEGGGGSAYTLTSGTNVERDSATQFTVPISGTDKLRVDALFNKNSTSADDGTTYNLAAADDFVANVTAGNTAIATNGVTVSNYANPAITSSTYDASTGALVVTGTGFSSISGASNDVVANTFTFTGDSGGTYTLTDTSNVDVTSATAFTLTLSATDKHNVNGILNKDLTSAESGQAYNLAAADNWMAGGASNQNIADAAATINVSNVTAPAVTSAAYNQGTGVLTVTGTNFVNAVGATNDVDVTKLTLTGEGGNTYTLTSSNVEISSATSFAVTLNAADKLVVNGLLNKNGTQADDGATNYNLNLADDYMPAVATSTNIADATNTVTVSNVQVPTITSATYDANSKALVVTGTGFARKFGATNDIDPTKLSLTGEGSNSYTLTGSSVEISSETEFTITLSDTDKINVNGLLNKDGTAADDSVTYNLAGAEDWQQGAAINATIADTTGNGVTVSSSADPTITSATYDFATGILVVTGTRLVKHPGATNDVDLTKLTISGEASGT